MYFLLVLLETKFIIIIMYIYCKYVDIQTYMLAIIFLNI